MRSLVTGFLMFLMMPLPLLRAADEKSDADAPIAVALKKDGLDIQPSLDRIDWLVQLGKDDLTDKGRIKEDRIAGLKKLKREVKLKVLNCGITEAGLAQLTDLPGVKTLVIAQTREIKGLAPLAAMAGLKGLFLEELPLTDEGFAPIAKLKGLEALTLNEMKLTDAGLAPLGSLVNLKELRIWNTDISPAAFEHFKPIAGLETLWIVGCPKVTSECLVSVKGMKKLSKLALVRTAVADKGLEHLKELPALKVLELPATRITDKSLNDLTALTALERLDLRETGVTEAGIGKLQKALPRAKIEH